MIEAIELCKQFERSVKKGRRTAKEAFLAVNHVSLRARPGEIIGILGPNGAGKTTLLRMLGMLMTPTSGEVRLTRCVSETAISKSCSDGYDADGERATTSSAPEQDACYGIVGEAEAGDNLDFAEQAGAVIENEVEKKAAIGYLSGNTKLYPRFSIREYLRFLGQLYGLDRKQIEERTAEISRVLDMDAFLDNRIEKLSTGQTQRASIARCLMADPQIYILDEPTLGLDILSADAIIRFMKEQKERGKTVLYSTHYLEEAQYLCDRVYMICDGRIVAQGTPQELLAQTGTESLREAFHIIYDEEAAAADRDTSANRDTSVNRDTSADRDMNAGRDVSADRDANANRDGSEKGQEKREKGGASA